MSLTAVINTIVIIQAITFFALLPLLIANGTWNHGVAQGMLGVITILIYWAS